jgi:hypothetical protein
MEGVRRSVTRYTISRKFLRKNRDIGEREREGKMSTFAVTAYMDDPLMLFEEI